VLKAMFKVNKKSNFGKVSCFDFLLKIKKGRKTEA
tara:strand:- start:252 stop:356 length:105 start_codon:yes stop_codon:yes gene_type:complete